jgi:asparagine synthase (glutamine-hydrolysing)
MCGIAGYLSKRPHRLNAKELLENMSTALKHRGPDLQNTWMSKQKFVGFAHARLSIVDLSEDGIQPMISRSQRGVITYNGEIYNHKSLREKYDLNLRGNCDTEVLLELIEKIGLEKTLEQIQGMFAFAYYDQEQQTVYIVRDRYGEKPLYYGLFDRDLYFGSELKCFKSIDGIRLEICDKALASYFKFNNIPAPLSIFKNINKCLPGHYLEIDLKNGDHFQINEHSYLDDMKNSVSIPSDLNQASLKLETLMMRIIPEYMDVDVPFGSFLSGGIDSSLITLLMKKCSDKPIRTFSIGFDDPSYDESEFALEVARELKTDHQQYTLKESDLVDLVQGLPWVYDEPFSDASQIPTCLVSKLASREVKVVLTGDAGDEVFGGYNRYLMAEKTMKMTTLPRELKMSLHLFLDSAGMQLLLKNPLLKNLKNPLEKVEKLKRILHCDGLDEYYRELVRYWKLSHAFEPQFSKDSKRSVSRTLMDWDRNFYLPGDILTKLDRASMASSLEGRIPFLHPEVVGFADSLPDSFLMHGSKGKLVLREVLRQNLPNINFDRPKTGFAIPLARWLRHNLRDWTDTLIKNNKQVNPYYEEMGVETVYNAFLQGDDSHQYLVWNIAVYQQWYESFYSC